MQVSGETMVFRNEHESPQGKWYTFSAGVSSKRQDGTYANDYLPIRFRKGVVVENKTKINIKESFFTVREYEANGKTQKVIELMILDFVVVDGDAGVDTSKFTALSNDDVPF